MSSCHTGVSLHWIKIGFDTFIMMYQEKKIFFFFGLPYFPDYKLHLFFILQSDLYGLFVFLLHYVFFLAGATYSPEDERQEILFTGIFWEYYIHSTSNQEYMASTLHLSPLESMTMLSSWWNSPHTCLWVSERARKNIYLIKGQLQANSVYFYTHIHSTVLM